jgi:hypothetical protein
MANVVRLAIRQMDAQRNKRLAVKLIAKTFWFHHMHTSNGASKSGAMYVTVPCIVPNVRWREDSVAATR